jgi:hypothetical protein
MWRRQTQGHEKRSYTRWKRHIDRTRHLAVSGWCPATPPTRIMEFSFISFTRSHAYSIFSFRVPFRKSSHAMGTSGHTFIFSALFVVVEARLRRKESGLIFVYGWDFWIPYSNMVDDLRRFRWPRWGMCVKKTDLGEWEEDLYRLWGATWDEMRHVDGMIEKQGERWACDYMSVFQMWVSN